MITLPTYADRDLTRIVTAIGQMAAGRSNAIGVVSLAAGVTSTTVPFDNCASSSYVFLTPLTAHAAAAVPTTYISSVTNKSFTIAHASDSTTDRTFGFACLG